MATINLGSIKFKWQGAYNGATAYTVDDVVSYNGSSYICTANSTGNLPTNTSYWDQMSSAGTNGTNGTDLTTTLTTQGDLVYRDGSGLQRLAAGTSGQYLKTLGSGANPTWSTLASNVDIITHSTLDSTGVTSITETLDWSTNNYWKVKIGLVYQLSADDSINIRIRDSVYGDITDDYYAFLGTAPYGNNSHSDIGNTTFYDLNGTRTSVTINNYGWNTVNELPNIAEIDLYKPDATNNMQAFHTKALMGESTNTYYQTFNYWGWVNEAYGNAKTGFKIYSTGGTVKIKNGHYVVMGYKYA